MNIGTVLAQGMQTYREAKDRQQQREDVLKQQAFANLMATQAGERAQAGLDLTREGQEYAKGRDILEDLWRAGAADRTFDASKRLAEYNQGVQRAEDLLESQRQVTRGMGPFLPSPAPVSFKEKTAPVTPGMLEALSRVVPQEEGPAPSGMLQEAALHPSPEQALLAPLIEQMKSQQAPPPAAEQGRAGTELEASRRPTGQAAMEDLLGAISGNQDFTYKGGQIEFTPPVLETAKERAAREKMEAETRKIGRDIASMDVSDDFKRAQTALAVENTVLKRLEADDYPAQAEIKRAEIAQRINTAYSSELLNIERAKKIAVEAGNIPQITRLRAAQLELEAWYKQAMVGIAGQRAATAAYSAETSRIRATSPPPPIAAAAGGLTPAQKKSWDKLDSAIGTFGQVPMKDRPAEHLRIVRMLREGVSGGWLTPDQAAQSQQYLDDQAQQGVPGVASSGRVMIPKP